MIYNFSKWLELIESAKPTDFDNIPQDLMPIVQDYWNLRKDAKKLCDISGEEHNAQVFASNQP